jgi:hypothetical protein
MGAWLRACDVLLAFATEGMMTDDFPDYDWFEAHAWGDPPEIAVQGAVERYLAS